MSEIGAQQTNHESSRPAYGEVSSQSVAEPRDRTVVQTLCFTIPYTVVVQIARGWLPFHLSVGIGCFGAMVIFRFEGPRRFGFVKWTGFALLMSAGGSLLVLAGSALWSALFRR